LKLFVKYNNKNNPKNNNLINLKYIIFI